MKAKSLEERVAKLEKIVSNLTGNPTQKITKKLEIGDTFTLAGLKWIILDITDQGYKCLAEKIDKNMQFDSSCNDWRKSSLRKYLNSEFLEKLEKEIGAENIIPFNRDLLSMDGQKEYGFCEDKVSLLNVDEYQKYRTYLPNMNDWWWLITPWSTPCNGWKYSIAVVSPSGNVSGDNFNYSHGVRPVCIFDSSIFES